MLSLSEENSIQKNREEEKEKRIGGGLGSFVIAKNCKTPELGMSWSHVKFVRERTPKETSSFSKGPADVVSWSGHSPDVWEEEEW